MNMFVVTIYPFLIEESFLLLSLYQPYYKYYSMAATLRICLSFSTKALSFRAVCILYLSAVSGENLQEYLVQPQTLEQKLW